MGAGNGAHPKHVAHLWRARRVEAQRLVKGRRLLPSRKEARRMRSEVYGLAGGGWRTRPRRTQRAGKGSTADWGQGTGRSADPEHVAHIRDAGGVEVQWLVKHRRDLSSNLPMVERKACGPEAGGGAKPRAGEGSTACGFGAGNRNRALSCTPCSGYTPPRSILNIACMVVTLEVSKLSGWLNADVHCRESKGRHRMRSEYTGRQAGGGGRDRGARSVQERARS